LQVIAGAEELAQDLAGRYPLAARGECTVGVGEVSDHGAAEGRKRRRQPVEEMRAEQVARCGRCTGKGELCNGGSVVGDTVSGSDGRALDGCLDDRREC
jgi:hypothetical protein